MCFELIMITDEYILMVFDWLLFVLVVVVRILFIEHMLEKARRFYVKHFLKRIHMRHQGGLLLYLLMNLMPFALAEIIGMSESSF